MSKRKVVAFSLIAAALLSWQVSGVNIATSSSSGVVEPCSSSASSIGGCFFVCPRGDGPRLDELTTGQPPVPAPAEITVVAKDLSGAPIGGILPADIWTIGCSDGIVLCGGGGGINADSVTNDSGQTTISGDMAGSGCDLTGMVVVIQGNIVQEAPGCDPMCLDFDVVSPDITGDGGIIDGVIELADFALFGAVYGGAYDPCYDYNCDGQVELADFSLFGLHWQHSCQGI
jgi:hypothetical protein